MTLTPAEVTTPPTLRWPTMPASRSAISALALPLSLAGNAVRATLIVSFCFGTPVRRNSKPLSAIGWPATKVPVPLTVGSAAVVSTRL